MKKSMASIVEFAYKDHKRTDGRREAECKICSKVISERGSTTSNFLRHVKSAHPKRLVAVDDNNKNNNKIK